MDLQEIKNLWRQHDEKLDRQIQLNMQLLRKIEFKKTRSALRKLMVGPILGIVVGGVLQFALGPFIFFHFSQPQFAAPALLLDLFAMLMLVSGAYQLSIIDKIDYDGPVAAIQKHVEKLRIYRIRYTTILKLSGPLLWVPVLIVGLKGFYDFDFYAHFDHAWIASQIAVGFAVIALGVWLAGRHTADRISWPWLRRVMGSMAGQDLAAAKTALKEIEDFAREE